jgi:hypothetical protein
MQTEIKTTDAAPLATFRILFGLLMFISIVRFWANGWIEKLYLEPSFHFKYYGFEWVKVPEPFWCYSLFIVCGVSSLFIAIGFKYRVNIILFFLSFTYIELMDKTTYLNHYYFISVLSFLLIFLPANSYFSFDSWKGKSYKEVPTYTINALKLLVAIVYIYAGIAKLNPDWLLEAMPLAIWLPSKYNLPLIGDLLQKSWVHYAFSWAGAFYDLFIIFFLLYKPTRLLAFFAVVTFHILTGILFPIGMFPYIMIVSTLIYFPPHFHHRMLALLSKLFQISKEKFDSNLRLAGNAWTKYVLIAFFSLQVLMPLRFMLYPGKLFWTEEGYRFSWRVMLMEKAGYAQFKVQDQKSGKTFMVDNSDFLSTFQEKQMATQADFILEYAHYLGDHFSRQGHENLAIYVDNYVALNGSKSRHFVDPTINLLEFRESFAHRNWVLPYYD